MTKWNQYLKDYRSKHPNMPYKEAQKKASVQYKKGNQCTSKNIIKKIYKATDGQKDKICKILDIKKNRKAPGKRKKQTRKQVYERLQTRNPYDTLSRH